MVDRQAIANVGKKNMTTLDQPVPELPVCNLDRARDYYCEKLGFQRGWALPEIASVTRGKTALFFRLSTEPIAPQRHWIFADDVDATFVEMRTSGAVIIDPISNKPWGLRQFTIQDLDGHQFYVHHDI
jgi:catechol 2,3-dioxygenase-like lactoylglutathione lyase family enzyme